MENPKSPLSINTSVKFMTLEDRSQFHRELELERIQLWCWVYKHSITTTNNVNTEQAHVLANLAVENFDSSFRPAPQTG